MTPYEVAHDLNYGILENSPSSASNRYQRRHLEFRARGERGARKCVPPCRALNRRLFERVMMLAVVWTLAMFLVVVGTPSSTTLSGSSEAAAAGTNQAATRGSTTTTFGVPASNPSAWLTSWSSAMDWLEPSGLAVNATVRDVAQLSVGGTAIRIRLSNTWGTFPLNIGEVTVGEAGAGATLVPGTVRQVTFEGAGPVVIAPGTYVTSDPIPFVVHAGEHLSVSVWVPVSAQATLHYCCQGDVDTYFTPNNGGNQAANPAGAPFSISNTHTRWLADIEVSGSQALGTVVAFGDSITDGYNASGFAWPKPLQSRINELAPNERVAVVNEGIAGNTLDVFPPHTTYALSSGGKPGLVRLGNDALSLPGTKDVVLFLGTNDLWFGGTAAQLIAGMKQAIEYVHDAGMKIFGVTLLPRAGSAKWTPTMDAYRRQVNQWIRSPSSGFDGVIDFASVVRDVYNGACQPDAMFPGYNSGDNLHPNAAGQTAMANAVPTTIFGIPEAPRLTPLVNVTLTPNCPAAVQTAAVLARSDPPPPLVSHRAPKSRGGRRLDGGNDKRSYSLFGGVFRSASTLLIVMIAALVIAIVILVARLRAGSRRDAYGSRRKKARGGVW